MKVVGWLLVVFGGIAIPGSLARSISGESISYNPETKMIERESNTGLVRGQAIGTLAASTAAVGIGVWMINGGAYSK
jgi:hypothetical protein